MPLGNNTGKPKTAAAGIFILMLMAIFVMEMVIGTTLSHTFTNLDYFSASLLDSAALTLLFAAPFWFIFIWQRPVAETFKSKYSVASSLLFMIVLLYIFSIEFLVMMLLPHLMPGASANTIHLTDACLTTLFSAPFLWWLVNSKHMHNRLLFMDDFLLTPFRLYALLLLSILLTDLLTDILYPLIFPFVSRVFYSINDALLSTLIIAPLLMWFVIRPITRSFLTQKTRANAVYAQAVEAIVTIDSEGMILSFNPAAERIFGYRANEIISMNGALLFEDGRQCLDEFIWNASIDSSDTSIVSQEARGRRQDSSVLIMDVSISGILLENKKEYLIIMRDITSRKRMERTIAENEERLSLVINGSNDGIWDWDIQTGAVYYSPRFKSLLGYGIDELQQTFAAFENHLHPDDHDRVMEAVDKHLEGNIPYDIQYRLRTKTGNYRWFRARGQVIRDASGRAERMAGSISDINAQIEAVEALRESELRFRQIFEQSEDAIIFLKPGSCSILDLNKTTEELFGYSKAELKEGGLGLICGQADIARLTGAISSIRKDRVANLDNVVNIRKDGTEINVSVRGKIMTLQGVDIICCSFRDITKRLHMEKEARDIQAKLIQTNKMTSLGLLVSGVAHEINNPNNFIMASSEMLEKTWEDALNILNDYYTENGEFYLGGIPYTKLEAESPRIFAGINDGARRINKIVNNLKNFSRNDYLADRQTIDANQVATTAVAILHYEINKFTKNFHIDLADNIPQFNGSSQQLGQVILNLLMNACQALPDNQSGIWLTTGFNEKTGLATISVRDEGLGISPEKSKYIMEPFFTTKLDSGGTGLGLSICQSIVKEHSWSLDFTSEVDKGTTFTIGIPIVKPAAEEQNAKQD